MPECGWCLCGCTDRNHIEDSWRRLLVHRDTPSISVLILCPRYRARFPCKQRLQSHRWLGSPGARTCAPSPNSAMARLPALSLCGQRTGMVLAGADGLDMSWRMEARGPTRYVIRGVADDAAHLVLTTIPYCPLLTPWAHHGGTVGCRGAPPTACARHIVRRTAA